ncbi:protein naked cuticle homolog 2-like isoform X2 [Dreissena polymorpha]|uniref:protein naked cuticle homolog 2-like isoform X2 n=1 Tax=Dreissena polymorpha TaxID=45954 RepID=UPI0022651CFB|nr:protein naked cuticle homolog 2-like isoform X2 [Dreissena polymorpha]
MGKTGSKHECFLVNAHLNKAWEDQIWKKTTKTGYNLANYNMNQSMSELSICLEDKQDNTDKKDNNSDSNVPLKVDLPPVKLENGSGKVFTFDQLEDLEKADKPASRLNIEEFECGVHFGGGENSKQEWSFTLYDFDGHGKITKEDLVGLLKALYDAIGSSIKIPNNGTKTLKLRLSVGQETQMNGDANQTSLGKSDKPNNQKEEKEVKTTPKKKDSAKVKESDLSKAKESPISKTKENIKQKDSSRAKVKEISRLNNLVGSRGAPKCNNETQAQSKMAAKERLGSHKHKELVSLVEENMERNHVKPLRRHHSDCRGCRVETPLKRQQRSAQTTNTAKDNNSKQRQTTISAATKGGKPEEDNSPKECQDRRNYYLDLAGVENNSSKFQDSPNAALESEKKTEMNNSHVITSTSQSVKPFSALSPGHFFVPRHFRSRSHETKGEMVPEDTLPDHCQSPNDDATPRAEHLRSRSFDPQDSKVSNIRATSGNPNFLTKSHTQKQSPTQRQSQTQNGAKFRPVSLPGQIPEMVSPHYHRRHRHRDKNHDLAMQQVAEWIEHQQMVEYEGENVVIQRHEHHHIHEHHHHHHYHHYYEA